MRATSFVRLNGWLLAVLVAGSVLTLFARQSFVADLVANLRVQLAIAIGAATVVAAVLKSRRAVGVGVVLLCVHLPWFARTIDFAVEGREVLGREMAGSAGAPCLKLKLVNVLSVNRNYESILREVSRGEPDVLIVLELTHTLRDYLDEHLGDDLPYSVTEPQDNGNFGIGLFARQPLTDAEIFFLNDTIPSITAEITVADRPCRVIATHPLPPMTPQTFAHRNLHLQKLSEKIRNEQQHPAPQPVIVVGDFNLTPWSPIFADFERSSGLHNAADGFGFTPTWYRFDGFPFGLVLDHVLVSGDMQCAAYDVGPDIRSDHRSVTVQLRFPDSTAQPE